MVCPALRNVPNKKVQDLLQSIITKCSTCAGSTLSSGGLCPNCSTISKAFNRYADANIPLRYWTLEMNKHFQGDDILKEKYAELTADLKRTYRDGKNVCFAGSFGLGKTMVCTNILKRAVEKGFSGLYVTLLDIISAITSNERYAARSDLLSVDFLVIDEFDPRYMSTDSSSDFFGRIIDDIFRTRSQNCLPTFMCTNAPNVTESFSGVIKQSLSSLMHGVETVVVLGDDFRAKK
jgi:DNA replication protein DnaC